MATKACSTLAVAGLIVAVAVGAPSRARAIEVKKDLYNQSGPPSGGGQSAPGPQKENPIPKAQQQALLETITDESDTYLNDESEKKASGKTYVDIEHSKVQYLPTQKGGKWTVIAKLPGDEYTPTKSGVGKGKATGKQKTLVFNYRLDGNKWTEVEQPKWEDADAGANAAAAHK